MKSELLPPPDDLQEADFEQIQSPEQSVPTTHPDFTQATETLGSLGLREMLQEEAIDLRPAEELARDKVRTAFDVAQKYGQFMPSVASAIVQYEHPSLAQEAIYPTAAQIKEESFGARFISGFLGFFSSNWASRFDNYLEGEARQRVSYIARQAAETVNMIGDEHAPKDQFVQDLSSMHANIADEAATQDKLAELTERLATMRQGTETEYPFLGKLTQLPGVRANLIGRKRAVRAFTPEIIKGVEQFLKQQGVAVETISPSQHNSLLRRLAQRFAPQRVNALPNRIESTLTSTHSALPQDGKQFKDSFYAICQGIVKRSHTGEDGHDLTRTLLDELKKARL